ncbi:MAG: hypothetical protein IBX36_00805 [Dehalococcoidia bacterium]|nr:hypothetical protein [Dehalococcoidia bacterium]
MTYSSEEIDRLQKRLEKAEDDILLIAKTISAVMCETNYNMFLRHFSGEEFKSYVERWRKKEESAVDEIFEATTVPKALQIASDFYRESFDYVKAAKVSTAEQAMDIAHSFIKKYSGFALPLKSVKEGDVWHVDIDVGAFAVKIAKIRVDARTGDILSYEIPEK